MSQQEQKPQWFWCNKHGDFAVRPICPECEHLGQAFTSSVTPAPPEASHRAIRDVIDRFDAELKRITNINVREDRPHTIPALTAWSFVQDLRAALSTGTETQEPTETPRG
jgi:hypothetical protein